MKFQTNRYQPKLQIILDFKFLIVNELIKKIKKKRKMNFKTLSLLLIAIFIDQINPQSIDTKSKLNTFELENFKYQIDIDNSIKPNQNDPSNTSGNSITLKSVNGQAYNCKIGDSLNGPVNLYNLSEEDDEVDTEEPLSIFDTHLTKPNNKKPSQYNFTLIHERVNTFSADLKKLNLCIYKV